MKLQRLIQHGADAGVRQRALRKLLWARIEQEGLTDDVLQAVLASGDSQVQRALVSVEQKAALSFEHLQRLLEAGATENVRRCALRELLLRRLETEELSDGLFERVLAFPDRHAQLALLALPGLTPKQAERLAERGSSRRVRSRARSRLRAMRS